MINYSNSIKTKLTKKKLAVIVGVIIASPFILGLLVGLLDYLLSLIS